MEKLRGLNLPCPSVLSSYLAEGVKFHKSLKTENPRGPLVGCRESVYTFLLGKTPELLKIKSTVVCYTTQSNITCLAKAQESINTLAALLKIKKVSLNYVVQFFISNS